jgi:hypothetical protein
MIDNTVVPAKQKSVPGIIDKTEFRSQHVADILHFFN